MSFIFRSLARVDGSSDFRASIKDSIETVEVLEELPSTAFMGFKSQHLSLFSITCPGLGSIPILPFCHTCLFPLIILEIFFVLSAIIPGIIRQAYFFCN